MVKLPKLLCLFLGMVLGTGVPFLFGDSDRTCEHIAVGKPSEWVQFLERRGYCELHDNVRKIPRWVSWHMQPSYQSKNPRLPSSAFKPDPDLPISGRAELRDYRKSGYDRGHMCPSFDMRRTKAVQLECFYLSNMVPQNSKLNQKTWLELEEQTRTWISQSDDTYIVCGPLFGVQLKTIGVGKVVVPNGLFKIIACNKGGKWHGIGFVCKNDFDGTHFNQWICSIENIQLLTGYQFLTMIPAAERMNIIQRHPSSINDW